MPLITVEPKQRIIVYCKLYDKRFIIEEDFDIIMIHKPEELTDTQINIVCKDCEFSNKCIDL